MDTDIELGDLPLASSSARDQSVPVLIGGSVCRITIGQILDLLVGAAPGSLDTLQELADALGDDPNYAASTAAALAGKASIASVQLITPIFGSVKLGVSGGNLLLSRERGSKLTIGGVPVVIPAAGLSLAPTGLTPLTAYYVYAAIVSGNPALEASTTGYVFDAVTGQALKSGDPTRTLVGFVRPIAGPAFADTAKQRFVRSWYNDPGVHMFANFTANRTTTSVTMVELGTEIRCEALAWAGETFEATCAGVASNNASLGRNATSIGFDSTTVPEASGALSILTNANDTTAFCAQALRPAIAEGYHFVTLLGQVNTNTGTWSGDSDGRRASIMARVGR